uniref:Putative conserved secreted protein n=1 Tax=Rhipicephalus microplus TaxID=6941 RepID=A0A6G5A467_RHIMP
MNRTLTILCFGLACVVGGVYSAALYKDLAGCTTPEAEKCGYDFVPYFLTSKLADDAKTLATQCTLFRRQLKCGEDFAVKCLDGLPKGVILLMLRAAVDEYGMFCNTTNPKHKEYLDSIKCINKAGPGVQTCMADMFVAMHRASKAPDRQQIPYSCCYYHDFVECAESALTRGCTLPAAKKFFNDIIDHVFGEVLSLACNKYKKGTGACEALPVLPTKDDAKARDKGFIEPLAVIASKLG